MAQVVLERLTRLFPGPAGQVIRAVDGASLVVEDRELLVLVGPSGCGKTTLLRLIAGLEQPTAGTVAIGGQVVNGLAPKEREVAMVFQNFALYPHMTVYENLAFGLKVRRFARAEIERRVRDTAGLLQLDSCLDRLPAALSGGQQQRVALGRALVRQPALLLLDEPLSNLDGTTRLQMRAEIARLHARLGSTMLYVTHDQTDALTLGDRVAVMREGRIEQVAPPLTLYAHPASRFVAGFIGAPPMNFFDGRLAQAGATLVFEQAATDQSGTPAPLRLKLREALTPQLQGQVGQRVVLGVRPEHISCSTDSAAPSADAALQATVELVQPMGAETYLHLAGHSGPVIARVPANFPAASGQDLTFTLDPDYCHLFDHASGKSLLQEP
jgi:multiple sugar transport system ATP-binding protein